MDLLKESNKMSNKEIKPATELVDFLKSSKKTIKIIPTDFDRHDCKTLPSGVGSYAKWIKQNYPELVVDMATSIKKVDYRDESLWLPLVYLAADISLPFYLGLVINYVYDKLKGLRRDRIRKSSINLETEYIDEKKKISKRFKYSGTVEGLESFIEKYNPNP